MRKGVSPVVAVVLLIAIAVIATVSVWYWMSPLASRPNLPAAVYVDLSIEDCRSIGNSTELFGRNIGGTAITDKIFYIDTDGMAPLGLQINISRLDSGQASWFSVINASNTSQQVNLLSFGYKAFYIYTSEMAGTYFNCR